MIKYKQINAAHPEDVGVPRKLMSDPPHNFEEETVLRKHKWPLVLLAFLLVAAISAAIGAAVWSMPMRTPFSMNMYGVKITAEGKELTTGTVILEGERLDYRSESRVSEFQCSRLHLLDTEFDKDLVYLIFQDDWITGFAQESRDTRYTSYTLLFDFDQDGNWCVIRQNDLYIVCSADENFDPTEILEQSIFAQN